MNYQAFFTDVTSWLEVTIQKADEYGIRSSEFWHWVAYTLAKLCEKYDNHELAMSQSIMLWDWFNSKIK